jgi:exoribonuclease-2
MAAFGTGTLSIKRVFPRRTAPAAHLLSDRIGERFDGIVTGASEKGTWVRISHPVAEGKVVNGEAGLDIGDKTRVKLIGVNIEAGFIDFARSNH